MEVTRSSQLQKFLKFFESTHSTLIPQYLKNLLDYCEYSEFTIRFFDENNIKSLEEFVKDEVSQMVSDEDWLLLTGGKFKDSKRFVFFPPVKLILIELAKFAKSTNIISKIYKTETDSSQDAQDLSVTLEEDTTINSMKRMSSVSDEVGGCEESINNEPKRLKLEDYSESEELRAKLKNWFNTNYREDPPINVQVYHDSSYILTARYVCHMCGSSIIFQNSRGWLRQNLYRHIRKHYESEKQAFQCKTETTHK